MPNLSIRRIDEETLARIRVRAARHGVSTEEEVRRILRQAVSAPERLGDVAVGFFGNEHGVDLDIRRGEPHDPVDLDS